MKDNLHPEHKLQITQNRDSLCRIIMCSYSNLTAL